MVDKFWGYLVLFTQLYIILFLYLNIIAVKFESDIVKQYVLLVKSVCQIMFMFPYVFFFRIIYIIKG